MDRGITGMLLSVPLTILILGIVKHVAGAETAHEIEGTGVQAASVSTEEENHA